MATDVGAGPVGNGETVTAVNAPLVRSIVKPEIVESVSFATYA